MLIVKIVPETTHTTDKIRQMLQAKVQAERERIKFQNFMLVFLFYQVPLFIRYTCIEYLCSKLCPGTRDKAQLDFLFNGAHDLWARWETRL